MHLGRSQGEGRTSQARSRLPERIARSRRHTGRKANLSTAAKSRRQYRILVADRGGVFRLGLKKLLAVEDDFRVVAQAENGQQVFGLVKKFKADLAIIESAITREDKGDLLARLRKSFPKTKILIVIEDLHSEEPQRYLAQGANGTVERNSDPANFVKRSRDALEGKTDLTKPPVPARMEGTAGSTRGFVRPADTLTKREKSIISCLLQGWRNREIAAHLTITEQTVKNHLRTIFDKVGVSDRLELVLYAIHHSLELPPLTTTQES